MTLRKRSAPRVVRTFDELADWLDGEEEAHIRVERMDGSILEGRVMDIAQADLLLVDESGNETPVAAGELRSVDTLESRRLRWLLAAVAIPLAVAYLVGFVHLPWVRPDETGFVIGFLTLMALVSAIGRIPGVKDRFTALTTRWERLYPPTEGGLS